MNTRPYVLSDGYAGVEYLTRGDQTKKTENGGDTGSKKTSTIDIVNETRQQQPAEQNPKTNTAATTQNSAQSPAWSQDIADRYKPNQNVPKSPVAQWQEDKDVFLRGFNEGYEDTSQQEDEQQTDNTALLDEYFKTAMLPDSPAASSGYQFGNQQTKAGGVMVGSGMDYTGQFLSAAGTAIEGLAEYLPAYGPYHNEIVGFNPATYIPERDTTLITERVSDPLREKGTELSEQGKAMVRAQKEGLGKFGRFAIDLGSAGTQMLMDIGLGVATGGGMAIPAAIRTFGSSAEQAAAKGAELNEQLLYAGTSAALSYGIEHVCNVAFSKLKVIAPGISDDFVTESVEKLAQKLAKTPAGANALKNIGMVGLSGLSEGGEGFLESLIDPVLQRLIYDENAETVVQSPKLLADAAYDGVIEGILGMFGRGTSTAVDLVENMIYDGVMPSEELLAAADASESEVLGAIVLNQMEKTTEENTVYPVSSVDGCDNIIKNMIDIDTVHLMKAAREGTRHGGVYRDAIGKKKEILEKSISSHANQVLEHSEKIKHPEKYDTGWNEKDARQKEGLLRKWEKDLKRNAEQAEIEIEVWKETYRNEY